MKGSIVFLLEIHLKETDNKLLKQIKNLFIVGYLYYDEKSKSIHFKVTSVKELSIIIDHFYKYPMITEGFSDFKLFIQAFHIVERQEHLTEKGLRKIVAIKASMNLGLSDKLKE